MSVVGGKHCSNSGSRSPLTLRATFASVRGKMPLLAHSSSEHSSRSKAEERTRGGGSKATTEAVKLDLCLTDCKIREKRDL